MQENGAKRVHRSTKNKMIAGVCGGLGEYFNIDPLIFRALFVLLVPAGGFGLLFYIVLAILIPREPGVSAGSPPFRENVQTAANDMSESIRKFAEGVKKDDSWFADKRNILGLAVVIIGFIVFVNMLFPRTIFNWGVIWALLIIIAGIVILKKRTP